VSITTTPPRSPRLLQVRAGLAVLCSSDDMRVAFNARKRRKDRKRRRREIDGLPSGLAVRQEQKPSFEVHVIPSGVKDFAEAGAGQLPRIEGNSRIIAGAKDGEPRADLAIGGGRAGMIETGSWKERETDD
jgi:hypothetical protein